MTGGVEGMGGERWESCERGERVLNNRYLL